MEEASSRTSPTSFLISAVEKPKSYSPASIVLARFSICQEVEEPCSIASTTFSTSSPAREAKSIDRFVVSSEDTEILEVARSYGAEVVRRPDHLATDEARTEPVLVHALETLSANDHFEAELVVTLEPTSPLRTPALIDRCIQMALDGEVDSVMTVRETREVLGQLVNGRFESLTPNQPRRRQEREVVNVSLALLNFALGTKGQEGPADRADRRSRDAELDGPPHRIGDQVCLFLCALHL